MDRSRLVFLLSVFFLVVLGLTMVSSVSAADTCVGTGVSCGGGDDGGDNGDGGDDGGGSSCGKPYNKYCVGDALKTEDSCGNQIGSKPCDPGTCENGQCVSACQPECKAGQQCVQNKQGNWVCKDTREGGGGEVCYDGKDNDGDGQIDEGCSTTGTVDLGQPTPENNEWITKKKQDFEIYVSQSQGKDVTVTFTFDGNTVFQNQWKTSNQFHTLQEDRDISSYKTGDTVPWKVKVCRNSECQKDSYQFKIDRKQDGALLRLKTGKKGEVTTDTKKIELEAEAQRKGSPITKYQIRKEVNGNTETLKKCSNPQKKCSYTYTGKLTANTEYTFQTYVKDKAGYKSFATIDITPQGEEKVF